MGLGGTTASLVCLGWLIESDEEAGFMIRVDRQFVCPSTPSSFSSLSPSDSWVYLKEYLGSVQDAWPRPNWILTDDTTLEGDRSEEGREEDLCRGIPPRPRPLPCPLPWIWDSSTDWGSPCHPARLSWCRLARSRALRTGEDGTEGQDEPESSKNACSPWALSTASSSSVGVFVSVAVSVLF